MSEVIAEAAARTEAAAALQQEARARQEAATAKLEAATARWEATQADAAERNQKLDGLLEKQDVMLAEMAAQTADMKAERLQFEKATEVYREEERAWRREYLLRQEKLFQEFFERAEALVAEGTINTGKILAKIEDQGEDIRAMKDALLKLVALTPTARS
ncbi:MAG TPA: hypothetical protein VFI17_13280 [Solirubrobacterales bacterium]|nr:hypothetical protein [Solirubrobacterales bacterium]